MADQQRWHMLMRPSASMFKFRLPWFRGKTSYLKGDVYPQPYVSHQSTECRLITTSFELMEWDHTAYEEQCYYFNTEVKFQKVQLNPCYSLGTDVFLLPIRWKIRTQCYKHGVDCEALPETWDHAVEVCRWLFLLSAACVPFTLSLCFITIGSAAWEIFPFGAFIPGTVFSRVFQERKAQGNNGLITEFDSIHWRSSIKDVVVQVCATNKCRSEACGFSFIFRYAGHTLCWCFLFNAWQCQSLLSISGAGNWHPYRSDHRTWNSYGRGEGNTQGIDSRGHYRGKGAKLEFPPESARRNTNSSVHGEKKRKRTD